MLPRLVERRWRWDDILVNPGNSFIPRVQIATCTYAGRFSDELRCVACQSSGDFPYQVGLAKYVADRAWHRNEKNRVMGGSEVVHFRNFSLCMIWCYGG
jgi:hypothetical protein